MIRCAYCNSTQIVSRRQLFLCDAQHGCLPAAFDWYDASLPSSLPPKSLFVQFLVAVAVGAVPLVLLGYSLPFSLESTFTLAGILLAAIVACLLLDLLVTHRRYRQWASECVCGHCRAVFTGGCDIFATN